MKYSIGLLFLSLLLSTPALAQESHLFIELKGGLGAGSTLVGTDHHQQFIAVGAQYWLSPKVGLGLEIQQSAYQFDLVHHVSEPRRGEGPVEPAPDIWANHGLNTTVRLNSFYRFFQHQSISIGVGGGFNATRYHFALRNSAPSEPAGNSFHLFSSEVNLGVDAGTFLTFAPPKIAPEFTLAILYSRSLDPLSSLDNSLELAMIPAHRLNASAGVAFPLF